MSFKIFAFCFLFRAQIQAFFVEEFLVGFKMASDVHDGGRKSRVHNHEIWQHFCIQSFAMSLYFDQQHDSNSYFVKKAKSGGSIQDGESNQIF
jgi:hypothetical protein